MFSLIQPWISITEVIKINANKRLDYKTKKCTRWLVTSKGTATASHKGVLSALHIITSSAFMSSCGVFPTNSRMCVCVGGGGGGEFIISAI